MPELELGVMDALIVAAMAEAEQAGDARVTEDGKVASVDPNEARLGWEELRNLMDVAEPSSYSGSMDDLARRVMAAGS